MTEQQTAARTDERTAHAAGEADVARTFGSLAAGRTQAQVGDVRRRRSAATG